MIKFGVSGMCDNFKKKHNSTLQMPSWLNRHKLDCYELSFTNGIRLSDSTAEDFGKIFEENGIEISVHAPYFINFASPNVETINKSNEYIVNCLKKMKLLGAKKLVFHPGSLVGLSRDEAFENVKKNLKNLMQILNSLGFDDYYLCPETMGKHGQIGSVSEIAELCKIDHRIIPTLDFGHINAFNNGSLKTESDFENVFLTIENITRCKLKKVHIHFSKIMYGSKGEIKHLTFNDTEYGPEFEPLARVLKKLDVDACVVSESSGTQTKDACIMKKLFDEIKCE